MLPQICVSISGDVELENARENGKVDLRLMLMQV